MKRCLKIAKMVLYAFIPLFLSYGIIYTIDRAYARQDAYATANNCKYDYNGLCYTESERPWLF